MEEIDEFEKKMKTSTVSELVNCARCLLDELAVRIGGYPEEDTNDPLS